MYIDDVHRTNRITTQRIVNEAARWGLSKERAASIVNELLGKASDAIVAANEETEGVPANLVSIVEGAADPAAVRGMRLANSKVS